MLLIQRLVQERVNKLVTEYYREGLLSLLRIHVTVMGNLSCYKACYRIVQEGVTKLLTEWYREG